MGFTVFCMLLLLKTRNIFIFVGPASRANNQGKTVSQNVQRRGNVQAHCEDKAAQGYKNGCAGNCTLLLIINTI